MRWQRIACTGWLVLAAAMAMAAEQRQFDLPAAPLHEALEAFSAATGMAVLYPRPWVDGQQAPALRGAFEDQDALAHLLAGSGLEAAFSDARQRAFTLRRLAPSAAPVVDDRALADGLRRWLCATPLLAPGDYRAALQLWWYPDGRVRQVKLLASTGVPDRDRQLQRRLGQWQLAPAVRQGREQPVTLLLTPQPGGPAAQCSGER